MAKKANVLFILFEGLADTVIDSQVLSHVGVMQKLGIANFEIWAFACDESNYQKSCAKRESAEMISGAKVRVFKGMRPASFGSLQKNAQTIDQALLETDVGFSHIHARTEYSAAVASKVKTIKDYTLIWDCRGDAIAELDYRYKDGSFKSKMMKALRTYVFEKRLKMAGRACDKALFVSEPLKNVMARYIGEKSFEILPCCASQELFFYDEGLRQKVRQDLGVSGGQVLYTYVGSLAPYQRFEDTISNFSKIAKLNEKAALLVLTPDTDKAKVQLEQAIPGRYILKHASFNEINGYLNASDVAYMLRDATPTNRVATPTKFAEYCLTGLPVIMNSAVEACYQMAKEVGNIIEEKHSEQSLNMATFNRKNISSHHRPRLSREGQVIFYSRLYS